MGVERDRDQRALTVAQSIGCVFENTGIGTPGTGTNSGVFPHTT